MSKPVPTIVCDACDSTKWVVLRTKSTALFLGGDLPGDHVRRVQQIPGESEEIRCAHCNRRATKAAQMGVRSSDSYKLEYPMCPLPQESQ